MVISFGVVYIPKELKNSKEKKYHNQCLQANDSIMCGYFRIKFINFMLKCKTLLDYTNLLSPKKYEKNDITILEYFQ